MSLLTGASLVLPGRDLSASRIAHLLRTERISVAAGVPTIWHDVVKHVRAHGGPPGHLREVLTGGSPVPAALIDDVRTYLGARVANSWGMTETLACSTYEREAPEECAGRPVPLIELRIVDEAGAELPHDGRTSGFLQARGPFVMRGPEPGGTGWLDTGDVATLDERGRLRITDRAKDLIKSGGEWIPSVALEGHLTAHPAVRSAAVVAAPDERWMERPCAFVCLEAGQSCTQAELRAHLASLVPRWWVPDQIHIVAELPRTSVGKIDKKALRYWARHGGDRQLCLPDGQH